MTKAEGEKDQAAVGDSYNGQREVGFPDSRSPREAGQLTTEIKTRSVWQPSDLRPGGGHRAEE